MHEGLRSLAHGSSSRDLLWAFTLSDSRGNIDGDLEDIPAIHGPPA
jgi:hypothetical protein